MAQQGFGARIRRAWHLWASQNESQVTYADFGAALAREEGREEPYSTSAISEWIAERSEPKARTYRAMARLSGFRVEWLMEGTPPEIDEGGGNASVVKPHDPKPRMPIFTDPNRTTTVVETFRDKKPATKRRPRRPGDRDKTAIAS